MGSKHTLEEIIILEFKFGTKRKNRKLCPISRTSEIESNYKWVLIVDMYFELSMECAHEITYTGPLM